MPLSEGRWVNCSIIFLKTIELSNTLSYCKPTFIHDNFTSWFTKKKKIGTLQLIFAIKMWITLYLENNTPEIFQDLFATGIFRANLKCLACKNKSCRFTVFKMLHVIIWTGLTWIHVLQLRNNANPNKWAKEFIHSCKLI